ncbi:acyl carrier protein [Pseudomonas syringae]|uniref:acyl carrier protein n=1 Tax=Pseudomonas syringae TaxID=317 RepID=UPI0022491B7D|nr:acyl carrier protein [Pseudomonas syringae]UZS66447.1 acyl carrier protein [Pseudomonas syringae]
MDRFAIEKKVIRYVCELAGVEQIAKTDELFSSGRLTSLKALSLIQWMESTFSIAVEGRDISPDNLRSVEAVSRFIELKTSR